MGRSQWSSPSFTAANARVAAAVTIGVVAACSFLPALASSTHPHGSRDTVVQTPPLAGSVERLRQWAAAVREHEPGVDDSALHVVDSWLADDLRQVVDDALHVPHLLAGALARGQRDTAATIRIGETELRAADVEAWFGLTPEEARTGRATSLLRRAALYHTDAAMLRPLGRPSLPLPGPTSPMMVTTQDGRLTGWRERGPHWTLARAIVDATVEEARQETWARLWYRAAAVYLVSALLVPEAERLLERARRIFPADGDLLFYSGCFYEMVASWRVQGTAQSAGVPLVSAPVALERAEELLRQALAITPRPEIRVRLSRVRGALGRHEEAAADLRTAAPSITEPLLLYFADLFLGDEERALGRDEPARQAYERAASLFPRAPSPRLAISELARRKGVRGGEEIARAINLHGDDDRDDPWWSYYQLPERDAEMLFAEVRRAFLEQDRQ